MKKLFTFISVICVTTNLFSQVAPTEKIFIPSAKKAAYEHAVHFSEEMKTETKSMKSSQSMALKTMSTNSSTSITSVNAVNYLTSNVTASAAQSYLRDFNQVGNTSMFSDTNVMNVVSYFKSNVVALLDNNMSSEIPLKFIHYFRAYDYHSFYQSSVNFAPSYIDSLFEALPHLYNKPAYWSSNSSVAAFRWEAAMVMDIDGHRGKMYSYIKLHMNNSSNSFLSSGTIQGWGVDAASSILWRGLVNLDTGLISAISNDTNFIQDYVQVINNTYLQNNESYVTLNYLNLVYPIAHAHNQTPNSTFNMSAFESAMISYESSISFGSIFHMKLASQLYKADSFLASNWSQLKQQYFTWEFPNLKSFDNGEISFYTNMTNDRREGLYFSVKEAKANFFKLMGDTNPIQGDTNANIDIYIYQNYDHYLNLNEMLMGISAVGGGVYIENKGEFYTFDREDELLPIQHLVKHEYVHYLDARYNIHGTFGEYSFYDWNTGRYAFWTEGLADFIASTPRHDKFGIGRYNASIIWDDILMNSALKRSLYQSTHNPVNNGARTYAYSNAAWSYLYTHQHATLIELIKSVRENRTSDFIQILDSISSVPSNETQYQTHLGGISTEYANTFNAAGQNGGTPNPYQFNPDMPVYVYSYTDVIEIDTIKNVIDNNSIFTSTYTISQSYNNPSWIRIQMDTTIVNSNHSNAMKAITNKINQKIVELGNLQNKYSGFKFVTGWMDSVNESTGSTSMRIIYEFPQYGEYNTQSSGTGTGGTGTGGTGTGGTGTGGTGNGNPPNNTDTTDTNTTSSPILKMVAYPNPVVDYLKVSGVKKGDTFTIYDLNGRLINNSTLTGDQDTYEINMTTLQTNVYILLVNQAGTSNTFKIIKR